MPPFCKDVRNTSGAETRDQRPYDLDGVLDLEQVDGRRATMDPETGKNAVLAHQELTADDTRVIVSVWNWPR
jgi:hypothetical protein